MFRRIVLLFLASTSLLSCGDSTGSANVFEIIIENISTQGTLTASNGAPIPIIFSPSLGIVHDSPAPVFDIGAPARRNGLENYAEDGDLTVLNERLAFQDGVKIIGIASEPVSVEGFSPLNPGQSYRLVMASESITDKLSLLIQFAQSNDAFISLPADGVALYDANGTPISIDLTSSLVFLDAGTEVNQEPGIGRDQPFRQDDLNVGPPENGVVRPLDDGFTYPSIPSMIRVRVNVIGNFDS